MPVTAQTLAESDFARSARDLPRKALPVIDWDTWDRLVFAREGQLFSATAEDGTGNEIPLFDFNPLRPEQVPPPEWARSW